MGHHPGPEFSAQIRHKSPNGPMGQPKGATFAIESNKYTLQYFKEKRWPIGPTYYNPLKTNDKTWATLWAIMGH